VNGKPPVSVEAFRAAVDSARVAGAVALLVERAGGRAFVPLRVP
jgi:hypothetical protein